jgi:hypothetical protein
MQTYNTPAAPAIGLLSLTISTHIARFLPPFPLSICRVQNVQQTPQGHEGCQQEEEEEEKEEEGEGIRRRERIHQYNPMNATRTSPAQAQVCMN